MLETWPISIPRNMASELPVFVILLERDAARHRHVYDRITPRLPSARIVRATDYRYVAVADWLADNGITVDWTRYPRVTEPKITCTISHLRVWQTIRNERIRHAIVLEDDIEILDDFEIEIERIISGLRNDCDFVHLYAHPCFQDQFSNQKAKSSNPVVDFVPRFGRSAYLLSGEGASKLAAEFRILHNHGDLMLSSIAARGGIGMACATARLTENLGQLRYRYNGEMFRSNVHVYG